MNYYCVRARIVYKFNKRLITDEYTNEAHLNDSKVNVPYSVSLACGNCAEQPYLAGDGSLTISNEHLVKRKENHYVTEIYGMYLVKDYPCRDCPFGGSCYFGKIYARPNYWGFKDENQLLHFQSCPRGYCCDHVHTRCTRHNTCNTCAMHRTGKLCGQCEDGYSESLMSVSCVANDNCDGWWLWPVGFLLAASYLLWYIYKGKLMPLTRGFIKNLLSFSSSNVDTTHNTKFADDKSMKQGDKTDVEKGYFDTMVYFVNIISSLKVKVDFQSDNDGTSVLYDVEKYFIRYLDVDIQQVAYITVCPFQGVNAVTKI